MENLLYKTLQIALGAGEIALRHYGVSAFSLKNDKSPVTQADLESNAYITQFLQKNSQYLVCSEEAVLDYGERKDLEYFWLVDPLDGTKDFLAKNGGWTINIALIHKNRPILGVVYAPCFYKLFGALKGFGSFSYATELLKDALLESSIQDVKVLEFLKTQKIQLDGARKIKDSSIVACDSIFHSTQQTQEFLKKYNLKVQKYGSSLKICALAEGNADLYPRFNGTSEWDIAACDIILEEAGGVVLDCVTKKPLIYNKESFRNNHFIAFAKEQMHKEIYKDFMR